MKRLLTALLLLSILLTMLTATTVGAAEITSTEKDTIVPMPEEGGTDEAITGRAGIAATGNTGRASVQSLPFTDVPEGKWFYNDVVFAYEAGLMKGITATTFAPNGILTRGELVTVLYRMDGGRAVSGGSGFTDVPEGKFYSKAVAWASQNGIVHGVTTTEFRPQDHVTREQIAVIFYRYCVKYFGGDDQNRDDLSQYVDRDKVSKYAKDAMSWAVGVGLLKGTNTSSEAPRLDPRSTSTRAQVAAFLHRLDQLLNQEPDVVHGRASDEIVAFIKSREGFSATPYWDYSQWTVGYGTRCGTKRDGSDVPDFYWEGITEDEADRLLRNALVDNYGKSVESYESKHNLSFTQGEYDALVSFTFSLGALWTTGGYKITDWLEAPADEQTDLGLVWGMGVWCRVAGNVTMGTSQRRIREAMIFLYDDYTGTETDHPYYCSVRYTGNGSMLTQDYTDDVGYYIQGNTYGEMPVPTWVDPAEAIALAERSVPTFVGWFTRDGEQVTESTVVEDSLTLEAHWSH